MTTRDPDLAALACRRCGSRLHATDHFCGACGGAQLGQLTAPTVVQPSAAGTVDDKARARRHRRVREARSAAGAFLVTFIVLGVPAAVIVNEKRKSETSANQIAADPGSTMPPSASDSESVPHGADTPSSPDASALTITPSTILPTSRLQGIQHDAESEAARWVNGTDLAAYAEPEAVAVMKSWRLPRSPAHTKPICTERPPAADGRERYGEDVSPLSSKSDVRVADVDCVMQAEGKMITMHFAPIIGRVYVQAGPVVPTYIIIRVDIAGQ